MSVSARGGGIFSCERSQVYDSGSITLEIFDRDGMHIVSYYLAVVWSTFTELLSAAVIITFPMFFLYVGTSSYSCPSVEQLYVSMES